MKTSRLAFSAALLALILVLAVLYVLWYRGPGRRYRQADQLRAMLAERGPRFRHVHVWSPAGRQITMNGYVRTQEEAAELRAEMMKEIDPGHIGTTAFFEVQVVPPGTRIMGTNEDFWASIEK